MLQLEKLYFRLKALGVPEESYYLQGLYGSKSDDYTLALVMREGKNTTEYEMYYKEKEQKHVIQVFTDFEIASNYFIEQLTD